MKRARVLLWALGALMCGILLFARLIDVLDRDDQPERISQSVVPTSPPTREAVRLVATEVESQRPDQPDVLYLDPPAQNSSHAIVPNGEQPAASSSPATETKSQAAADPIEVSPTQAPNDEFVMLTATATIRNGPSDSADIIGRAHAGARARGASRDSGWAQIVDPASGNSGWVDSSVLVPSAPIEAAANEETTGDAPDATLDRPLEDQGAHSANKSRQAAKAKHHRANHNYGRRRFAFRFFFRGFLR
jgi:hypothetical protein